MFSRNGVHGGFYRQEEVDEFWTIPQRSYPSSLGHWSGFEIRSLNSWIDLLDSEFMGASSAGYEGTFSHSKRVFVLRFVSLGWNRLGSNAATGFRKSDVMDR